MRLVGLLMVSMSLSAFAAFACSTAPLAEGPGVGADPNAEAPGASQPQAAPTSSSCLGKEALGFDKPACDECMSAQGCQATIACFKGDADCETLQNCMQACSPTMGDGGLNPVAKAIFTTEVFPSVNATCATCQMAAGPGTVTFAPTADATYDIFKGRGFDQPNSAFVLKGAHEGPAPTPAQLALITKWVNAETPIVAADGGGAGGGGDGDGTGATKLACQTACKTAHPTTVEKWNTYNTCVSKTCATACL